MPIQTSSQSIGTDRLLVRKAHGTYIHIYGVIKPPHLLPRFVPDHLVLSEITTQTFLHGVGAVLSRKKRDTWPTLPVRVESYQFTTILEAVKSIKMYHFA